MRLYRKITILCFCAAMLLGGCALKTVDQMYRIPRRSETENHLQSAIDAAMGDMEYAAPVSGENQQTVQRADLDGDGDEEYLVFARFSDAIPLKILIFDQMDDSFVLCHSIECSGSVFEQVEYVEIDDRPGLELVVGKRVSNQVIRSLSVFSFSSGEPELLMTSNYYKFLTCNLMSRDTSQIMVIQPGQAEAENGVAVLFCYQDGQIQRSREAELSQSAEAVKRIMVSSLESGEPAVYVACSEDENAIITDVFAIKQEKFTNVSFSNESGTSVQTLRNYYIYADDVDNDGVLELPSLMSMVPLEQMRMANQQYLIRWYSMDLQGRETDKMYTFHNFPGGWYLKLNGDWASRICVVQESNCFLFYLWDEDFRNAEHLLTIYALSGTNRDSEAQEDGRLLLFRSESVSYAAKFENTEYSVYCEDLIAAFQLIHIDWKTGET